MLVLVGVVQLVFLLRTRIGPHLFPFFIMILLGTYQYTLNNYSTMLMEAG